jgi:hypothetical protein
VCSEFCIRSSEIRFFSKIGFLKHRVFRVLQLSLEIRFFCSKIVFLKHRVFNVKEGGQKNTCPPYKTTKLRNPIFCSKIVFLKPRVFRVLQEPRVR